MKKFLVLSVLFLTHLIFSGAALATCWVTTNTSSTNNTKSLVGLVNAINNNNVAGCGASDGPKQAGYDLAIKFVTDSYCKTDEEHTQYCKDYVNASGNGIANDTIPLSSVISFTNNSYGIIFGNENYYDYAKWPILDFTKAVENAEQDNGSEPVVLNCSGMGDKKLGLRNVIVVGVSEASLKNQACIKFEYDVHVCNGTVAKPDEPGTIGWCTPKPVPGCTPTDLNCTDGIDNDCDNLIDSADADECPPTPDEVCDDAGKLDEDNDSKANCDDPDCAEHAACQDLPPAGDCIDRVNNGEDPLAVCQGTGMDCSEICPFVDQDGDDHCPHANLCIEAGVTPGDCDDDDAKRFVGNTETCTDSIDNDCDNKVDSADEDCAPSGDENCTNKVDDDGDGAIDCDDSDCASVISCQGTLTSENGFCKDNLDNDNDSKKDCADPDCENDQACKDIPLVDTDDDGYNDNVDCDINDASIHPDAPEICGDDIDQNCSGAADETCEGDPTVDDDGDGFCESLTACSEGSQPGDCSDKDITIRPGVAEICDDNKDNNCDGLHGVAGGSDNSSGGSSTLLFQVNDNNSNDPFEGLEDQFTNDNGSKTTTDCISPIITPDGDGSGGCGCDLTDRARVPYQNLVLLMLLAGIPVLIMAGVRYRRTRTE